MDHLEVVPQPHLRVPRCLAFRGVSEKALTHMGVSLRAHPEHAWSLIDVHGEREGRIRENEGRADERDGRVGEMM